MYGIIALEPLPMKGIPVVDDLTEEDISKYIKLLNSKTYNRYVVSPATEQIEKALRDNDIDYVIHTPSRNKTPVGDILVTGDDTC